MNARQVEACAARLPPPQRAEFMELVAEARALWLRANAVRRAAWTLYRSVAADAETNQSASAMASGQISTRPKMTSPAAAAQAGEKWLARIEGGAR